MKDHIEEQPHNATANVAKAQKKASSHSNASHAGSANSKGDSSSKSRKGGVSQKTTPPQRKTSSSITHATKSAPRVPDALLTFPTDSTGPGPPYHPQMMMAMSGGWGPYPPYFMPSSLPQMGPAMVMPQGPAMMQPYPVMPMTVWQPQFGGQMPMQPQFIQPAGPPCVPQAKIEPMEKQAPAPARIPALDPSLQPSLNKPPVSLPAAADQEKDKDTSSDSLPPFSSSDNLLNSLFNRWTADGMIQDDSSIKPVGSNLGIDYDLLLNPPKAVEDEALVPPSAQNPQTIIKQHRQQPASVQEQKIQEETRRKDEEEEAAALLSAQAWGEDWMKESKRDDEDNNTITDMDGVAGLDDSLVDMDPEAYMVGERGMGMEEDPFMQQRVNRGSQQGLVDWWRSASQLNETQKDILAQLSPPAAILERSSAAPEVRAAELQAPQAATPGPAPVSPPDYTSMPAQYSWSDMMMPMGWQAQYQALQQQQMAMMSAMSSGGMNQMQMQMQMQSSLQKQHQQQMMMAQPYMMSQPYPYPQAMMPNFQQFPRASLNAVSKVSLISRDRKDALRRYQEKKKTRSIGRIIYEQRQMGAMARPRTHGRFKKVVMSSIEVADGGMDGDDEDEEEGEEEEEEVELELDTSSLLDKGLVTVVANPQVGSTSKATTRASHPSHVKKHDRGAQAEVEKISTMLRDVGHAVGDILVEKHMEGQRLLPADKVAGAVALAVEPFMVEESLSLGRPAIAVREAFEEDGVVKDDSVDQPSGKRSRQA